tara:strand:- start:7296 stop:9851 length:2556 start_codon:yes stop_codon:yes gene_type:complete
LYKAAILTGVQAEKSFLGRYELQKKIAVGGMAELYLAQVSGVGGFQKQVVVKRILPQLAESKELFRMFLDEARIAATLQHPNVVQVYDSCQEDGEYFMAMEYLDGTDLRTLRKVLADKALPLPWEHAVHIVTSIAAGLHYAHDKRGLDNTPLGIVHRDVTPHNIFLTREGGVKLVDFGIAKAQGRIAQETALGTLKGKLAYMSPEQCQGEDIDRRSDLYSLGVILFELTTGRRLYKSTTEYQLIKEIVETDIKPPSSFMEYPKELEAIVLKCLEKNPDDRYSSAREIQADLEGFSREYQIMASALGFSTFLEPLLTAAEEAAEKRWQHRKEKEALPVRKAPSAKAARTPRGSIAVPKPSTTPRPNVFASVPSIPSMRQSNPGQSNPGQSLGFDDASEQTVVGPMFEEEERTVRVPTDMLERIRAEEREMLEQDRVDATDGIPRIARGTDSAEHSVSANVVSRESSKIIVDQGDIFESMDLETMGLTSEDLESVDLEIIIEEPPAVAPLPVASTRSKVLAKSAPVPVPEPIERAMSHTAIVPKAAYSSDAQSRAASSQAETFTDLSDQELRVTKKNTGVWVTGALAIAVVGGGLIWSQQSSSDTANRAPEVVAPTPRVGALSVGGAAGAKVWLFLGRTPVSATAVNGEDEHRIRIEHEGYHSLEATLGPERWERDESGNQFAAGAFTLRSTSVEADADEPEAVKTDSAVTTSRPATLQVASTPSSANAWLFVGTTPNVSLGNLDLTGEIQLRIEQGAQPPQFRVLCAGDFDARGKAHIEVGAASDIGTVEATPSAPTTEPAPAAVPAPEATTPTTPTTRKWRPRNDGPNGKKAPGTAAKRSSLRGPTPSWAQ